MKIRQAKKSSRRHRLGCKTRDGTFNKAWDLTWRHWRRGYKGIDRYQRLLEFFKWREA